MHVATYLTYTYLNLWNLRCPTCAVDRLEHGIRGYHRPSLPLLGRMSACGERPKLGTVSTTCPSPARCEPTALRCTYRGGWRGWGRRRTHGCHPISRDFVRRLLRAPLGPTFSEFLLGRCFFSRGIRKSFLLKIYICWSGVQAFAARPLDHRALRCVWCQLVVWQRLASFPRLRGSTRVSPSSTCGRLLHRSVALSPRGRACASPIRPYDSRASYVPSPATGQSAQPVQRQPFFLGRWGHLQHHQLKLLHVHGPQEGRRDTGMPGMMGMLEHAVVNCMGPFSPGVALDVRPRWPVYPTKNIVRRAGLRQSDILPSRRGPFPPFTFNTR
ncbi:hypothetical protein GGR56DRAFT_640739 [Xylariaceae sp. FL0804]|nr:hypothetical protein GGR56DRAFT_640739 [Xylariaceae sp. FL0804]